jgi:formylglycine-generating enzyme required for sulfatase activity/tRNA A-37 threonylcarbamoyl transferase component Bud32
MFCTRCGKKNVEGVRFCYACGHDLTQSTPPESLPSAVPSEPDAGVEESVGEAGPTDVQEPAAGSATDPSAGLAAGALIAGRYRIERLLGQGGMGSVYLATDEKMARQVALKFINRRLWRDHSAYRRFIQEANVCLDLTHANIIRVHILDEWQGQFYLAMEYLDGETLFATLNRVREQSKTLPWKTITAVMQQVLAAVGYAHSRGVIHRDLKPANIMLAREKAGGYRAVVMDFGLAKPLEAEGHTRLGASLGTPYYMAPEQHGGAARVDYRADIYSLGVIAYEMVTGRLPMGRPTPPSKSRSDLPGGVDDWIFRAIEHDPGERFASVQEMAQALGQLGAEKVAPVVSVAPPQATVAVWQDSRGADAGAKDYVEAHAGLSLEMVWIPGGTFQMGSNDNDDEKPVHPVELDGFWLGKYQVTQRQYEALMGTNPSHFKGPNRPVEQVSWEDAMAFCRKLSQATGKSYTLPTEAQWEYACRAGSSAKWCFGDDESQLGEYAWYEANSGSQTHDVGQKRPNAWGLYDMHGNVWEWCADWYGTYSAANAKNPTGPLTGQNRVIRGGAWFSEAYRSRSAYRCDGSPGGRYSLVGFRFVRTQK